MKDEIKKYLPAGCLGMQKCDFRSLVYYIINIIEQLIVIIFALAVLVFLWGIFKYIFLAQGDEKQITQARDTILYGILGLFVMVSFWGIVNILQNTFFG